MNEAFAIEATGVGVFITAELDRRVPNKPNYLREKIALENLAAQVISDPEEILPRLVDFAMEIAGGTSAGISLFEDVAGTAGVFRWNYLCGLLAPFNGATTPREHSPCGVTLDSNAPVLASHPERAYNWIADAGIVVPEVLLVPLYIGGVSEPLGTLWIVSEEEGHFDSSHARAVTELASFAGMALHLLRGGERSQRP